MPLTANYAAALNECLGGDKHSASAIESAEVKLVCGDLSERRSQWTGRSSLNRRTSHAESLLVYRRTGPRYLSSQSRTSRTAVGRGKAPCPPS